MQSCYGVLYYAGLLLAFSDKIDKTTHRSFVPSIEKWCKVVIKLKNIVPYIFIAIIAVGAVLSSMSNYALTPQPNSLKSRPKTQSQNERLTKFSVQTISLL